MGCFNNIQQPPTASQMTYTQYLVPSGLVIVVQLSPFHPTYNEMFNYKNEPDDEDNHEDENREGEDGDYHRDDDMGRMC